MEKKKWPTFKSCKHQCSEAKGCEFINMNDRLSQLPHDILMSIMSLLTMKEAGKTSVLSRTWYYLWRCLPVLFFKVDPSTMINDKLLFPQQRSGFTGWVKSVVGAHLGPVIDELRVICDLDVKFESDIDKWVVFALSKQVKHLELDFTPFYDRIISLIDCYAIPGLLNVVCHLLVCMDLCIVNGSIYLTHINLPHLSLQLKHLKVSDCPRLLCINIKAPKLVSFTHHGRPIDLHIGDSPLLSEVSIGNGEFQGEFVNHACISLSKYLSNVKFITWDLLLDTQFGGNLKLNLGINNPPCMTNLKHMEFHVRARGDETLLGWADLIEAPPFLEKLTMKFSESFHLRADYKREIVKRKGRPLKSLKTLQHIGRLGQPIEIEFATYVVENSIMLKHVFFAKLWMPGRGRKYAKSRIKKFKNTLPEGVTYNGF